jgi:tetratricopeptide (TPR) repeat protein
MVLLLAAGSDTMETDLNDAAAYFNRGNVYFDKGQYDQAISDYTKALEIDPKMVAAYVSRGLAYKIKGQYEQGDSDFNKARDLRYKITVP